MPEESEHVVPCCRETDSCEDEEQGKYRTVGGAPAWPDFPDLVPSVNLETYVQCESGAEGQVKGQDGEGAVVLECLA